MAKASDRARSSGRITHEHWTRFQRVREPNGRYVVVATCSRCPAEERINDTSAHGMSVERISARLAQRGWRVGSSAAKDVCPACIRAARDNKPEKTPKEAPMTVPATTLPAAPAEAASAPPLARAEPPRTPTLAEKRKVLGAVEDAWNYDTERYRDAWTDQKLAESLKVPRAWVTSIRVEFFGPTDACDAEAERKSRATKDLEEAIGRATDAYENALDAAEKAERCLKELRELKAALGA